MSVNPDEADEPNNIIIWSLAHETIPRIPTSQNIYLWRDNSEFKKRYRKQNRKIWK